MSEEELIETLRAFEKNRVEQLEEPAKNLFYAIMKIADERDRLKKENAILKQTMCDESLLINENALLKDIIKEVREYIKNHTITNMEWWITGEQKIECKFMKDANPQELLGILDKESK